MAEDEATEAGTRRLVREAIGRRLALRTDEVDHDVGLMVARVAVAAHVAKLREFDSTLVARALGGRAKPLRALWEELAAEDRVDAARLPRGRRLPA